MAIVARPYTGHGLFLPIHPPILLPCATCTVSNDIAVDETFKLKAIVLHILEPASFLHWLLPRCYFTPFLSELHVIGVRDCEVFVYWRRVIRGVSNKRSNDKRTAKEKGVAVTKRLACSPPTKTNRVQSPAGPLPDLRTWETLRTMPLVGGFSRDLPFGSILTSTPSSALKTSLLRAAQISSLTRSKMFTRGLRLARLVVSGVVWTNRTMVSSNRTGVRAVEALGLMGVWTRAGRDERANGHKAATFVEDGFPSHRTVEINTPPSTGTRYNSSLTAAPAVLVESPPGIADLLNFSPDFVCFRKIAWWRNFTLATSQRCGRSNTKTQQDGALSKITLVLTQLGKLGITKGPAGAISLFASHQGEPGLIPGWVTGFSQVGIVPDALVGEFSRRSPVSPPFHSGAAPYPPQSPSSALKTSLDHGYSPPTEANRVPILSGVTPLGFPHVGIVPDDAAGMWGFSRGSPVPSLLALRPLLHTLSRDLDAVRAA
ncbi:hypothetical protein PR048_032531 [Dryococelus australis]|uniref:Uncharacterized protein n=1 Tax=Dryococelus australis TaxID=614101 RepID=A0ABQ9G2G3_9NEOP|nr:hypothetical protein PR048_032531 [Dryococelus australis]